jgi:hypothetical protein
MLCGKSLKLKCRPRVGGGRFQEHEQHTWAAVKSQSTQNWDRNGARHTQKFRVLLPDAWYIIVGQKLPIMRVKGPDDLPHQSEEALHHGKLETEKINLRGTHRNVLWPHHDTSFFTVKIPLNGPFDAILEKISQRLLDAVPKLFKRHHTATHLAAPWMSRRHESLQPVTTSSKARRLHRRIHQIPHHSSHHMSRILWIASRKPPESPPRPPLHAPPRPNIVRRTLLVHQPPKTTIRTCQLGRMVAHTS